jgi:hypothetical protein
MNLDDSLREKQMENGPFEDMAQLAQALKFALRRGKNWEALPPESKEALELIATHFAKILSGDASTPKHWDSIAILARLRGKALQAVALENSVSRIGRQRIEDRFKQDVEIGDA